MSSEVAADKKPYGTQLISGGQIINLGNRVRIYGSRCSAYTTAAIQADVDNIYESQCDNDFGDERYALLFLPNYAQNTLLTYNLNVRVGYYTQVLGLGMYPEDVHFTGTVANVTSPQLATRTNVLNSFWRCAENIKVTPSGKKMTWAVSQSCPLRRVHVVGDLALSEDDGYSSGGYMSDCYIEKASGKGGIVESGSQQQWFARNSEFTYYNQTAWNTCLLGCQGMSGLPSNKIDVGQDKSENKLCTVKHTPKIREKPYLAVDEKGDAVVVVPKLCGTCAGVSWKTKGVEDLKIPLNEFHVAIPDPNVEDHSKAINLALRSKKPQYLLLTPGIYQLREPIRITKPYSVILGLGLATLRPTHGLTALEVSDVDGVTISGILLDQGPKESSHARHHDFRSDTGIYDRIHQALFQIGEEKSGNQSHEKNPIVLHDIFVRVGPSAGSISKCVEINSHDVIGDHLWVWRADHGPQGTIRDPYLNFCKNGLIVNGDRCTMFGLFVEHFLEYQTIWNGDEGRLFFYQSEIPYFVPPIWHPKHDNGHVNNCAHQQVEGYASYKIGNNVKTHDAKAMGIYTVFYEDGPNMTCLIEAPEKNCTNITFTQLATVNIMPEGHPCRGSDYYVNRLLTTGSTKKSPNSLIYFGGIIFPSGVVIPP